MIASLNPSTVNDQIIIANPSKNLPLASFIAFYSYKVQVYRCLELLFNHKILPLIPLVAGLTWDAAITCHGVASCSSAHPWRGRIAGGATPGLPPAASPLRSGRAQLEAA